MSTSEQLMLAHGSPVVPLADVCKVYFNLGPAEAKRKAGRNELPVPTFRLTESQKAPLLIKVQDLAEFIDRTHEAAQAEWVKSKS